MITTLTLDRFEKKFYQVESQEMRFDIYSHIFDSVKNMDENLQHFVSIFEQEDVIKGVLHYSYFKSGALINHFHVDKSARDQGVLYDLLKGALLHMQLDDIESITINTTYLIANKLLLNKVEKFIRDWCDIKVIINVYEEFI